MNKERKRELLAEQGREHLLWELEAERDPQTMGVEATAYELGKEDAPLPDKVEAFARSLDNHIEGIPDEDHEQWRESVEERYGDEANEYL